MLDVAILRQADRPQQYLIQAVGVVDVSGYPVASIIVGLLRGRRVDTRAENFSMIPKTRKLRLVPLFLMCRRCDLSL